MTGRSISPSWCGSWSHLFSLEGDALRYVFIRSRSKMADSWYWFLQIHIMETIKVKTSTNKRVVHGIPVCSETTCIDDETKTSWRAQSVKRNSTTIVLAVYPIRMFYTNKYRFCLCQLLSDKTRRRHCRAPETRCYCVREYFLIDSKSSTGKSNSSKKNQTAEFEILLDSNLKHFEGKLQEDKFKFMFCWNRQQKHQQTNKNKKERKHHEL